MLYGMGEDKVRTKSVTKDGKTKELKVTQVENGYVVCVTTSYMEDDEYKSDKKVWISKDDPIPSKDKEDKEPTSIIEAIKSINF